MGFLSWLFPTPEDRIAKARVLLEQDRFAAVRAEVLDLEHPDAPELLTAANRGLALMNLEAAVAHCRSGDEERTALHLQMATDFANGEYSEQFRATRREIREIQEGFREQEERLKREETGRLMEIHPDFVDDEHSELLLPPGISEEEADNVRARLALLLESYPKPLRKEMIALGPEFAQAVLDLEDGKLQEALKRLVRLPDERALVRWERARAAHALGDPAAAARSLRAFERISSTHYQFGNLHSGVLLSQCLAESGRVAEGLDTLRTLRKKNKELGSVLFANLLETTGELAEAETVMVALLRKFPQETPLYTMLARIRAKGGHRVQAMQALEQGIAANPCTPGRCGSRPPDLAAHRMLATLYFEDGLEIERAHELAETARSLVTKPNWEDHYLAALVAQSSGDPEASTLARDLWSRTPKPLRPRLEQFLSVP